MEIEFGCRPYEERSVTVSNLLLSYAVVGVRQEWLFEIFVDHLDGRMTKPLWQGYQKIRLAATNITVLSKTTWSGQWSTCS